MSKYSINSDINWMIENIKAIKDEHITLSVSEWSESTRYLPSSVTPLPGYYSFDVAPYLREIVDCMSIDSPVRIVAIMKGAQIGATVGVLENTIGYGIEHIKSAPMMAMTVDKEVAQLRVDQYIMPMLFHSNLSHLIQSNETENLRKTGKTKDKISWAGGGFLLPFGATNANKLRSFSIQYLLIDECDGFKKSIGRDGDPVKLAMERTSSYTLTRKILILSTPLIAGNSRINEEFLKGDQRYYFVPCKKCGFKQSLKWQQINKSTGEIYGLTFAHKKGEIDISSIRYICENCGESHINADKYKMLNGGKWRPTTKAREFGRRSYHISALYSPVGFKAWENIVFEWAECWDIENNSVIDVDKLQVWYNNNLGIPFRAQRDKLKLSAMHAHRRTSYKFGEIPNFYAQRVCNSEIMLLTCAVDVHKAFLAVAIFGWTEKRRAFLIDYWHFKGECIEVGSQPWQDLEDLINHKYYIDNQGRRYMIALTLIDSGYAQDVVLLFCENTSGTIPIKGIHDAQKGAQFAEFKMSETKLGLSAVNVNVNLYKERWYSALKKPWDEHAAQHDFCINLPVDTTEKQLRELTVETKVPDINPINQALRGFKWHRPSGAPNELWDLLIYNNAAIDVIAWDLIVRQGEREFVNWIEFFNFCKTGNDGEPYYYELTAPIANQS